EDALYYSDCAKKVVEERESFEQFLLNLGWNVIPSKTNFVFAQHPSLNGEVVYQKIKQEGILVRHFNTPGIENFVRISIGTKEQMDKLKQAIKLI
ncbi:MAG: aminotransferase class I/II-fold pyridoxal phosphate-dependent enzyme, partial [Treponema sp.]|nr:aminotransferase class I/II-fold pyridoxal phosphate-dependent enzyme [Treponema sp.]